MDFQFGFASKFLNNNKTATSSTAIIFLSKSKIYIVEVCIIDRIWHL